MDKTKKETATMASLAKRRLVVAHDADANPQPEAETASVAETETSPVGEAEATPVGEAEATPVGEADATPVGDAETAPVGEVETTPVGDAETTPVGEAEVTPLSDVEETPVGDAETTSVGDAETAPVSEAEVAPVADAEEAADAETTPVAEGRPDALRLLEAMLFASAEPLDEQTLAARLPAGTNVKAALAELQAEYASRGVNLVHLGQTWTFRTAADLAWLLTRESVEPKKLSRAAIETLAIIAYHQPVSRAEIEEIRGVATSKGTLDVLLETGWIRPRGRRKTPGRPLTFGTSEAFLAQFGLEALGDLPGLEELKGSGLLDGRLPPGFSVPMPSDDPALREDEDPLEPGDLDLGLAPRLESSGD